MILLHSMERILKFLKQSQPVTWLFYGDSITHGAFHTHGGRDYSQIFNERIRYELGRTLDAVINTASSGNTTGDLLDSFAQRVDRYRPDVVFVMIGMNDCAPVRDIPVALFRSNLERLCDLLTANNSLPVLQTSNTILPGSAPDREANFGDYMEALRTIAADRGLPLVDHCLAWQQQKRNQYFWMDDGFHPNSFGHLFFARTLFQALAIDDPQGSHVCRQFIPQLACDTGG